MADDLFAHLEQAAPRAPTVERLFFGLMLPETQAGQALDVLSDTRRDHDLKGSAIRKDRLHVTLIHIGDYRDVLPASVIEAAQRAGGTLTSPAFDVSFDRASSFSGAPGKHPHILLGDEGVDALKSFRGELLKSLVRQGVKPLSRQDFTPHITLAYGDQRVPDRSIPPIAWRPAEFVLIHSEVGRSVYRTLGTWPLHCGV